MAKQFRRKIYDRLLEWKRECRGEYAILIEGARRVGKSTVARTFGKNEYKSYLTIDFSDLKKDTFEIFENGIGGDFDTFFMKLQVSEGVALHHRNSLIIFDEVQLYPKARQMIKHLVADRRYDYLETGSLISIMTSAENILIPSEEIRIRMHPMDFEEFLWAMDDTVTVPFARNRFENRIPMGDAMHRSVMSKYREYVIVGGMPQAVSAYLDGKDLGRTDGVKRMILDLYHSDFSKISSRTGAKAEDIFRNIPSMLSRTNRAFSPGTIKKGSRTREYVDSVAWLEDSMAANVCRLCTDPDVALNLHLNDDVFKCYMADTGLLVTQSFLANVATPDEVYRSLLFDRLSVNKGMFFENMVAQELTYNGHKLVFSAFKNDLGRKYEVDFIIVKGKKILPIEVKSSVSRKHASLDAFIEKYGRRLGERFVIHPKDLSVENGITYLPIYMAMFL
ncbi:MAG: ATP-binding protein [Thermoplasmatales archaeon]|nr:ATP-binding protein [Thermoplasmatales archaeon]